MSTGQGPEVPVPHRRTLSGSGSAVHEAKRSRFYGYARPLPPGGAAATRALQSWVADLRLQHRDARHVVFAWRDARGEGRGSDDGEPHGSGARPCGTALARVGADCAAVAVARIFGGILLGPAGLARAYAQAADGAVVAAGVRELVPRYGFESVVGLGDAPAAERVLHALHAEVAQRDYTTGAVTFRGHVADRVLPRLARELAAATGGRALVQWAGEPDWY